MAEEISGRPVSKLASFTTFDDGRPRLDGMMKGRRWDIDHEHREFERDTHREVRRLMKLRCRQKKRALYRATTRAYEAAHKPARRAQRLKRYWKNRPKELAKLKASRTKHQAKRNAEARSYYHAHREACLARNKAWAAKNRPPKGIWNCSVCSKPGHNRRTCRSGANT